MLSESEKEKLKNFMLTQGTGPLSVEFRESRGELENFQKRLENLQNSQILELNASNVQVQQLIETMKNMAKTNLENLIEEYNVSLERLWDGNVPDIKFKSCCTFSFCTHFFLS